MGCVPDSNDCVCVGGLASQSERIPDQVSLLSHHIVRTHSQLRQLVLGHRSIHRIRGTGRRPASFRCMGLEDPVRHTMGNYSVSFEIKLLTPRGLAYPYHRCVHILSGVSNLA